MRNKNTAAADGLLDIMTRPNGSIVQSTYTERNQIAQILLDGPPPVVDYSYNLRGLMIGKTYESGGLSSSLAHDAKGQVLSVTNNSNAGTLDQFLVVVRGLAQLILSPC